MLTVYSTQGSPGASTTAMHLAAHWASTNREVLLIEADPAGGSLSHNLGIQFTPGSASFVASGLPVLSNHLIDHAQDVLFENLHVMPAPGSPAGAAGILRTFADSSQALRTIAENEIAVIVDGGRITADTAASGLTTAAAGLLVVCRSDSQLSSLGLLTDVLAHDPDYDSPQGCAVTIGKSPMDSEEWRDNHGMTFCGEIEDLADMTADLSAFLNRHKRKSKKWRISLEQVADDLYQYAQPPASDPSRRLRPAEDAPQPGAEPADAADQEAPAAAPAAYEQPHHPQPQPGYQQPTHPTPPPQPPPGYQQPTHPTPPPQPQPGGQSNYLPPTGWLDTPQGHGQPQPGVPPEGAPAYAPPPPASYAPSHPPAHSHQQPQPPGYEPRQPEAHPPTHYSVPAYEQPGHMPQPHSSTPSQGQPPPVPPDQSIPGVEQLEDEPPPAPDIKPTGSFRDWAARLHGSNAEEAAADNRGV